MNQDGIRKSSVLVCVRVSDVHLCVCVCVRDTVCVSVIYRLLAPVE